MISADKIYVLLSRKLHAKGLLPIEIQRLVKDVSHILKDSGESRRIGVNQALERLGWRKDLMDDSTYELIIYVLENFGPHDLRVTGPVSTNLGVRHGHG